MNLTTHFTELVVSLAKSYCNDPDEAAAPEGGGSFAEYAMISLHGLRIFLDETYEMIVDHLEVIPPILEIIGLEPDNLPRPSTLNEWLDKIVVQVWRVQLRRSAQLHDPSPHAAVDATYYERSPVRGWRASEQVISTDERQSGSDADGHLRARRGTDRR